MKPTGKTFEISTLADIFALPTVDQMERCLDELRALMVETRKVADLGKKHGLPYRWPKTSKWTDDSGVSSVATFPAGNHKIKLTVGPA